MVYAVDKVCVVAEVYEEVDKALEGHEKILTGETLHKVVDETEHQDDDEDGKDRCGIPCVLDIDGGRISFQRDSRFCRRDRKSFYQHTSF